MASAALTGSFPVDEAGRKMTIGCWGSGTPTVIFEGGDGSVAQFQPTQVVQLIAAQTRVCLYDHAGHGSSDPAPNRKREAEDLADDLHALLAAAHVDGPFVLAGSSFGGMVVTFYASRFPDDVVGVLTLDTPAPSAELNIDNFPEGIWDAPGNDDHLDILCGFENRFAKSPVHFTAPLTIITATGGQSNVDDQKHWLQTSPQAKQIELPGGHDIYLSQSHQVAEQILFLVHGAAAGPSPS
jgi:pimeloyl-ACP methyl ester carboxylesterase